MVDKLVLISMIAVLSSCGKDSSPNPPITLLDGVYSVDGPVCTSTSETPSYPDASASATLYDFHEAEYSLTIAGMNVTQELTSGDCKMVLERELSANNEGFLGIREKTSTSSTPEGCELTVIHDDTTFRFSSEHPILKSNDKAEVEILYEVVTTEENQFVMSSRDEAPDNTAWEKFGCSATDQIEYSLVKI
jgi:hypothetical protein